MIDYGDGSIIIQNTWNEITGAINDKGLAVQYREDSEKYEIYAIDNNVTYQTTIYKGPVPVPFLTDDLENSASWADFENNYKPLTASHVTWTVNTTRGGDASTPFFVTGSISVTPAAVQVVSGTVVVIGPSSTGSAPSSNPVVIAGVDPSGSVTIPLLDFNGAMIVTGAVHLDRGDSASNPLYVTGTVGIAGVNILSGALEVTIKGANTISGALNVTGTVHIDRGDSGANPLYITSSNPVPVTIAGAEIIITASVIVSNVVTVSGSVTTVGPASTGSAPGGDPVVIAGVNPSGSVTIPLLDFNGAMFVTGTVHIDRGDSAANPLYITGTVGITGVNTLSGALEVTIQGANTISGALNVTGTVHLDKGDSAANPLYVTGSISVTPAAVQVVSGTVVVIGPASTGSAPGGDPVLIAGINPSGSVTIPLLDFNGAMFVTGTVHLDKGDSATNPLYITGTVGITGVNTLSGALEVTIQGANTISGALNVTGTVHLDRGDSEANPLYVTGTVGLSGVSTTSGALNVNIYGANTISGALNVTGTVHLDRGDSGANPLYITSSNPVPVTIAGAEIIITASVIVSNVVTVSGSVTTVGPASTGSSPGGAPVLIAGVNPSGSVTVPLLDFDGTTFTQERTEATFGAWVTGSIIGNNKSMLSIYNAGSQIVRIREIWLTNVQTAAVVGIAGVFEFRRMGGHSAGTLIASGAIETMDTADVLDAGVTIRTNATVASESSKLLWKATWSTDEWGPGSQDVESNDHVIQQMFPLYNRRDPNEKPITLRANQGMTIKFTVNSNAGTFDVHVVFTQSTY